MKSRERAAIVALAMTSAVLRAIAFFRYRFDSDEAQHLHVTWGWTAGLLQYRDVFDNHVPLFHILTAPILEILGEREDVLLYMRAPMLLLFAVVVLATYILGARLYSPRVGAWSALLLTLLPPFFLKSLEYRNDNLWNAFWCLALVVLTGGALTNRRIFFTGLLLGLALGTSMKTSLLILTLAAGSVMMQVAFRRWTGTLPAITGLSIVPAALLLYFWRRGALSNLLYCVFTFNELLAAMRARMTLWAPRLVWLPAILILVRVAWRKRPSADDTKMQWRFFFAFCTAFFVMTLIGFWILISPRDLLPFLPLGFIFLVAFIERRATQRVASYVTLSLLFVVLIVQYTDRLSNHTCEEITMMHQLLRLTRPGEPVMDLKGETIYRPRPYYYIFEFITRNALQRGLLPDTIPEDVIRKQCHVAQADGEFFPPRGRAFLSANFLDMGRLRAAGMWIKVNSSFTIAVPGDYVVIARTRQMSGFLDGTPYRGRRYLAAGRHVFNSGENEPQIAGLWAPALERGFSPFHLQDRDF